MKEEKGRWRRKGGQEEVEDERGMRGLGKGWWRKRGDGGGKEERGWCLKGGGAGGKGEVEEERGRWRRKGEVKEEKGRWRRKREKDEWELPRTF